MLTYQLHLKKYWITCALDSCHSCFPWQLRMGLCHTFTCWNYLTAPVCILGEATNLWVCCFNRCESQIFSRNEAEKHLLSDTTYPSDICSRFAYHYAYPGGAGASFTGDLCFFFKGQRTKPPTTCKMTYFCHSRGSRALTSTIVWHAFHDSPDMRRICLSVPGEPQILCNPLRL